jgi:hypothetical protein
VTLRVLRADGVTAAAAADVRIQLSGGRGIVDLATGIDGRITATGVPLGAFLVKVTDPVSGGVAYVPAASVDSNGQVVDLGDLVLDITPLSIVSTVPADGATEASTFDPVRVVFSQPLYPGYTNGIRLYAGATLLPNFGVPSADGRTLTFTGTLPVSTEITISVPTSVFDVFLRHPPAPITRQFRTTAVPPLAVLSITPADGATNVATNTPIRVEFSVPIVSNGLRVMHGDNWMWWVTITMSEENRVATITGTWPADSELTVEALGSLTRDIHDRLLGQTFRSRFRTPDTVGPFITSRSPASGALQVAAGSPIVVTFNEPISSVGTFVLLGHAGGTVEIAGNVATLTPASPLVDNAIYRVRVSEARDLLGNEGGFDQWTFTTRDTLPPTLRLVSPTSTSFYTRPQIEVAWTDVLSAVDMATATLQIDGADVVPTTSADRMRYTPTVDLADGTHTIRATVADVRGNVSPPFEATFEVSERFPSVRLTYVDEHNQPIAGGNASLAANNYYQSLATDASGHALFTRVPVGYFSLTASSSDHYVSTQGTLSLDDYGLTREVVLRRPFIGRLVVRATAGGGTPLPGVEVEGMNCADCPTFRTGPDGTVSIDYVVVDPIDGREVAVNYQVGYGDHAQEFRYTAPLNFPADGATVTLDFAFPLSVIRGVARFPDGTPVDYMSTPLASFVDAGGNVQTVFGAALEGIPGGYGIWGVPPGQFQVSIQNGDTYLAGTAIGAMADIDVPVSLDVTIEASGTVTGTVLYGPGQPAPFAYVTISNSRVSRLVYTDADGRFELRRIALGPFQVDVEAQLAGSTSGTVTADGETVVADVLLPASGTVMGIVRDAGGARASSVPVRIDSSSYASPLYAFSNAQGEYRRERVPIGALTVTAFRPNGVVGTATGTLAAPGETAAIDVALPPTARLVVRVRNHDGSEPLYPSAVATPTSGDAFGVTVGVVGVEAGLNDYQIEAIDYTSYLTGSTTVSLTSPGQVAEAMVTLVQPASLTVVVPGAGASGPWTYESVVVSTAVAPFGSFYGSGSAFDAEGHSLLPRVPPGLATVNVYRCADEVCEAGTATLTLAPGEAGTVTVAMSPQ